MIILPIFISDDNGISWRSIAYNPPRFHPWMCWYWITGNGDRYCGTDMGKPCCAVRTAKPGLVWMQNLPAAVSEWRHIHPRDRKPVIGTYGRGVWVLDDMKRTFDILLFQQPKVVTHLTLKRHQGFVLDPVQPVYQLGDRCPIFPMIPAKP